MSFIQIDPKSFTVDQAEAMARISAKPNEGPVVFAYRDSDDVLYVETENGTNPWAWKNNQWIAIRD